MVVRSTSRQAGPLRGVFSILGKRRFALLIGIGVALTGCTKPPVVVFLARNYFTQDGSIDVKRSGLCQKGLQVTITTTTKTYTSPKILDLGQWDLGDIPVDDRYEFVNGTGFSIEALCYANDGRVGRSKRTVNSVYSTASGQVFGVATAQTEERPESYMLESPAPPIEVNGSTK
jgi:hypothetical protein